MKTSYYRATAQFDAKQKSSRRYRNILANSGEIMESGEVRSLSDLYVMSYDGKLIRVADLDSDPEKQTEKYAVKAQADHGTVIDGEVVPTIEKQFGACKVWLEEDGLHARMYFADNDQLADHAWAISEDASYSTGIDWYPEGYYGVNEEISEPIGILREVSMVLTGNDPRAKTIDSKASKDTEAASEAQGVATDGENTNLKEEEKMTKKTIDALTPDERKALGDELNSLLDRFTTDAPESETEPTSREETSAHTPDSAETAEAPEPKESKTDAVHNTFVVVRDSQPKQKVAMKKTGDSWLTSKAGHIAFADCLKRAGHMGGAFDAMWRAEASKHMSLDGFSGLPTPAPVEQIYFDTLAKSDGIISHFEFVSTKSLRVNVASATNPETTGRAAGHKKGDTKQFQEMGDAYRDILVKMVYKKLDLDATEMYENPWVIDFRARELVEAIIVEQERAAVIGDGRSAGTPDLRMFDGTRGFYSIKADAADDDGVGGTLAATLTRTASDGLNLYDLVTAAHYMLRTEGRRYIVAKGSAVTKLRQTKVGDSYLVAPGSTIEQILDVSNVYTPAWMDTDTENDAYLIVDRAYKMIGEPNPTSRSECNTTNNTDVLLVEAPRGGSLGTHLGAIAIQKEPEAA